MNFILILSIHEQIWHPGVFNNINISFLSALCVCVFLTKELFFAEPSFSRLSCHTSKSVVLSHYSCVTIRLYYASFDNWHKVFNVWCSFGDLGWREQFINSSVIRKFSYEGSGQTHVLYDGRTIPLPKSKNLQFG